MDAFEVLGVSPDATERDVRAAFRKRALREHPDRLPDDPHASEKFKALVRAYEDALALSRGEIPRSRRRAETRRKGDGPPPPPIRERFACPACDDTFPVNDLCPRCELGLTDTWQTMERPEAPHDPRIDALIASLELGPRWSMPELPIPESARPWIASVGFLAFGMLTTEVGLVPLGAMLASFGLFIAAVEVHDRATRPAKIREMIF
jgi:hypothetical protein